MDDLLETENQFPLSKTSYLTVGGISRQCVKFLPKSKSKLSTSIVIGDTRGVIYITHYKKTEPEISLRTNPYPKEITCIQVHPDPLIDKIFFSSGNSIYVINRAYTDKNKIEFNVADDIKTFQIIGDRIWTVCNSILSEFEYGSCTFEKGNFDNEAKILSIYVSDIFGMSNIFVIIGSEDDKIKFVENNLLFKTLPVKGGVNCFTPLKISEYDNVNKNILFGTTYGTFGIIEIKDKENINIIYTYDKEQSYIEIVDLKVFDINYDGHNEIIAIKNDGMVEIFQIGATLSEISLISKINTKEHLTGMDIGRFKTNDKDEIMLVSLTGLVFSLTPQLSITKQKPISVDKKNIGKMIYELQREVDTLKDTYIKKLEAYNKVQNTVDKDFTKNSYKIEVKFTLNQNESIFALIVDSEFPLELIMIHCQHTKIDILDIITRDVSMNIIDESVLDDDTKSHTKFMATLKLKEATHRLELLVRTYEGIRDELNITVIPNNKPKTAQIVQVPIYALSFHKKYDPELERDSADDAVIIGLDDDTLVNSLIIEGITPSELNQYLHLIIPNIPAQIQHEKTKYVFRSMFLNTLVEISIDGKVCEIKSVNLSTLITLKEQIQKEANIRKKEFKFRKIKIKSASVFKILETLHPKIEEIFEVETQFKVVKAFQELGDTVKLSELPEEYVQILNKKEVINMKYKQRTINLKYLVNLVKQLLMDLRKERSVSEFEEKIKEIELLFENYSYDKLKEIFSFLNN